MKQISSVQNPIVKSLLLLQEKSKARKQSGTFLIEGQREIELAIRGNYEILSIYFLSTHFYPDDIASLAGNHVELIEISREVYQKLAYRDTTEGILAVAVSKSHSLDELKLRDNPLILVAESPEKPGNLGALLRTADAAGIDAVIIADPKSDLYNPNIVRSSVGCIFTNQIAIGTSEEVIAYLNSNNVRIFSAALQDSKPYYSEDYRGATALVVGTESTGLTSIWRAAATQNILIPMQGEIDSMNVSVAAAVLIFEAKRQRDFT